MIRQRELLSGVVAALSVTGLGVFGALDAPRTGGPVWRYEIRTPSGEALASIFQGVQSPPMPVKALLAIDSQFRKRRENPACDRPRPESGPLHRAWSGLIAWVSPPAVQAQGCGSSVCMSCFNFLVQNGPCGNCSFNYAGGGPCYEGLVQQVVDCGNGPCCSWWSCENDGCC